MENGIQQQKCDYIESTVLTIKFLKYCLMPFGIILEWTSKRLLEYFYVLYCVIMTSLMLYSMLSALNKYTLFIHVLHIITLSSIGISILLMLLVARKNRKYFVQIYTLITQNIAHGTVFDDLFFQFSDTRLRTLYVQTCWIAIPLGLYNVIGNLFLAFFIADTTFGYDSPELLIFIGIFPWQIRSALLYFLTILAEVCLITVTIVIYFGCYFFTMHCSVMVQAFADLLKRKIKQLDKNEKFYVNMLLRRKKISPSNKDLFIIKLNDVIKLHQTVLKYVNLTSICLQPFIAIQLIATIFITILDALHIQIDEINYMIRMRSLSTNLIFLILYIYQSYYANLVNEMNNLVNFQLYDMEWCKITPFYRKHLNTNMTLCQRSLGIQIFKFHIFNVTTVTVSMKYCYSIIQFLSFVKEKTENSNN